MCGSPNARRTTSTGFSELVLGGARPRGDELRRPVLSRTRPISSVCLQCESCRGSPRAVPIFLGDLRAAALLPMRATNVAAARAEAGATVAKVRVDAVAVLGLARELAIDSRPIWWGSAHVLPAARRHHLLAEARGGADHELSGYRYDAILRLDVPAARSRHRWHRAESLADILARLDDARPGSGRLPAISPTPASPATSALSRAVADAAPADAARRSAISPPIRLRSSRARSHVPQRLRTGLWGGTALHARLAGGALRCPAAPPRRGRRAGPTRRTVGRCRPTTRSATISPAASAAICRRASTPRSAESGKAKVVLQKPAPTP